MSFLPIAILAYAFAAGSTVIDKILLRKSVSNPLTFTFYVNILQLFIVFLIPFGFSFSFSLSTYYAIISGIVSVLALYAFFVSLKYNEASTAGPLIGIFNPFFALLIEWLALGQLLTKTQYLAVGILGIGSIVFTHNQWSSKLKFNHTFLWMIISGFLFGLAFVLLRLAFQEGTFLNGLIISRIAAGLFAATFLIFPIVRRQIRSHKAESPMVSKTSAALLLGAQILGAISGLLISFGITLASASLVNSLFGVQYITILLLAIILAKKFPHVLDEHLSKNVVIQKIIGVFILSLGLFLLAR